MKFENRKWLAVALLSSAGAMNFADRTVVSVLLPLIRTDLHLSDFELGSMGVLFLWTYALAMPLAGWVADRTSRSRTVTLSFAAWSAVTLVTAFVHTLPQFYATRILMGLAECFYVPAAIALIAEHHSDSTRGTAMGLHLAGINIGLVIGGTAAGYVGQRFGWQMAFVVFGAVGLVLAFVTAVWLREPNGTVARRALEKRGSLAADLAFLVRVPTFGIQLAQAMLLAVGVWIFLNWLPLFYAESFGLSLATSGFSGTFMPQFSATVGIAAGGWLSDRIARRSLRRRMLMQCVCYAAAAPFLLGFLDHPAYFWASTIVFLASALRALGQANEDPVLCDVLPDRVRSTAIAIMNTGQCLTGGLGVLLAGYLKSSFGLAGVFAGIPMLILAAAVVCGAGYLWTLPRDLRVNRGMSNEIAMVGKHDSEGV
jgi:MFS family permease